jgi:hypothetical protein
MRPKQVMTKPNIAARGAETVAARQSILSFSLCATRWLATTVCPTARILKSFRHHDNLFTETAPKTSRSSANDDAGLIDRPRCSNTGG